MHPWSQGTWQSSILNSRINKLIGRCWHYFVCGQLQVVAALYIGGKYPLVQCYAYTHVAPKSTNNRWHKVTIAFTQTVDTSNFQIFDKYLLFLITHLAWHTVTEFKLIMGKHFATYRHICTSFIVFNRPGVAGAVL